MENIFQQFGEDLDSLDGFFMMYPYSRMTSRGLKEAERDPTRLAEVLSAYRQLC